MSDINEPARVSASEDEGRGQYLPLCQVVSSIKREEGGGGITFSWAHYSINLM